MKTWCDVNFERREVWREKNKRRREAETFCFDQLGAHRDYHFLWLARAFRWNMNGNHSEFLGRKHGEVTLPQEVHINETPTPSLRRNLKAISSSKTVGLETYNVSKLAAAREAPIVSDPALGSSSAPPASPLPLLSSKPLYHHPPPRPPPHPHQQPSPTRIPTSSPTLSSDLTPQLT